MVEHARFPVHLMRRTTQAAEGLPRRPWTVAEIEAMVAAGIVDADERFELLGGEAVPLAFKSGRHELVKMELNEHFQCSVADDVAVVVHKTLRLDGRTFLEPLRISGPAA